MALIEETPLISTVVMGISAAFVGGMITSKLRLSPIVGYLLAGIVIGPHTPGFVGDSKLATQLAEIGIVLLMFGVGLHFSLKDLMAVKKIALPGAVVQIATATALGAWVAHYWGWSLESGLLFGLALSVASTVVLLRSLEERNALHSINGHIAVGWLIVEDLAIVLALVLIPALAPGVGGEASGTSEGDFLLPLLMALGKIALFVAFMFVVGKRVLPWILQTVADTKSRELFTLSVFVVAVGVAFGAAHLFGISFALGAFFAGMMIKESDLSHEVTEKAMPFQDAFAVLFFVSVGMLFNPMILVEQPWHVLATALIIMFGKSIAAFVIVLMFRYPAKTAFTISASLAQIGEFSFILGTLGLTYGLLSHEANSLILAGALLSITLNPMLFNLTDRLRIYCSHNPRFKRWMEKDSSDLCHLSGGERTALKNLVILVGYGRVGRHLSKKMEASNIDFVVVDQNHEVVESIRQSGKHALVGDATHRETLQEAAIDKASALVVAVPNPYEARRIVGIARDMKPDISILARAHNEEELEYFKTQNIDLAVAGVQEVARRMMEHLEAKIKKK
ncbi:MAG: sodium:proton antiporter [Rickettsiaceae bacterium]|jgi:CPA2 family monovalent cation:H+ antiporter-2|nr:sodium:proton antiporter [Rickettsiaceae bacterium]